MNKQSVLNTATQGVKGKSMKMQKQGYVDIQLGETNGVYDKVIIFDAFEGAGDTYKRREETQIRIFSEEKAVFIGTFDELVRQLKNDQN